MQNRLFRIKQFTPYATQACVLRLKPCQRTPQHFEYDQIQIKIFGWGHAAFEKRKTAKTINCHHSDVLWKKNFQRYLLLWNFHTEDFPSFQPIFKLSTRMLIFRNKPGSKENSFLPSPSLKYLDFYDVSKNSEHINTFRGAPTQKVTLPNSEV